MKLFGYYLIEPSEEPFNYLSIDCECFYSVSHCLCDLFPDIQSFWGSEQEQHDFANKMGITQDKFHELSTLYHENGNILLSHFYNPDTVFVFLELFKQAGYNLKILSIHLTEEDHSALSAIINKETGWSVNENPIDDPTGKIIGKDIIGLDVSSFHSWLCNSLHEDEYPFKPQFNQFGLLENSWEEVREFSRICQGQGEPVVWFPCLVKEHQFH